MANSTPPEQCNACSDEYRTLVENCCEGIFRTDAKGVLVFANRRTAELLGYAVVELLGRHFTEFDFGDDLPRVKHNFESNRQGQSGLSEYRMRRKDGSYVWVAISSVPVFDAGGVFLGLTGFATDIDERKRREEIAAHERRLLRLIAGNIPLAAVLEDMCNTLEASSRRPLQCAVMLADDAGRRLECIAAPSLPEAFRNNPAIMQLEGSDTPCAQAVRSGQPAIVPDTSVATISSTLSDMRQAFGFGAVWSYPIIQDDRTLGTLLLLPLAVGVPDKEDGQIIEFALQVARLAIAHDRGTKALRASEQRFRDFADMAADWYWEQDAEFRFTEVSYGASSRPAAPPYYDNGSVGKHRWDLPYVNVPEGFWEAHRRQLVAGEPFSGLRLERQDAVGGIRTVEISGRPQHDGKGRLMGYRGVGRDISKRVAAENQLRQAKEWLQLAVGAANIGLWERDVDTWEFRFSDEWKAQFGYAPEEVEDSAAQFDRLIHPDDQERIHAFARGYVARPEGEYSNEFRIRHKDGTWRWVLSRGAVVADPASGRRRWMGCHVDITEHKQLQEALRESELCFRDYADLAADWFWEQDASFRFTKMSGGVVNKGNFRIADCLSRARWELPIESVGTAQWAEHRAQLERHETFHDFTYSIRAANNALHWYAVSGKPVYSPDGTFFGYRGTARDITARILAEHNVRELNATLEDRVQARTAELEAANHELDAYNYSVSHDLRAPLRSVEGFSQALLEDHAESLDATGRDYLQRIGVAARRMAGLIDAMYHLSRLSRSLLQIGKLNMSAKVLAIVEELRHADPGRRVDVVVEPGIAAEGDPELLGIVLTNLLDNAWKYTARTEQTHIAFGALGGEDGNPVYYVRDNGAGFDMLFADKLFKLFQRLHREDEYAGHGVGLATAQRIVHRHGGRIWAEGTKGQGAVFYFTLWADAALRRATEADFQQRLA